MSDLKIESWLPQPPVEVYAAFEDIYRLRRWYGAPPGCHRTDGDLVLSPGESFRIALIDGAGNLFSQTAKVVEQRPDQSLTLETSWQGGGMPQQTTRAQIELVPADGGTRIVIRHGAFESDEQVAIQRAFWEGNLAKLARVVAGEPVPCFEEFRDESKGYVEPLGLAAYTVLVGLREAGAASEVIDDVEETLYSHLERLPDETCEILEAVLRERLKELSAKRPDRSS